MDTLLIKYILGETTKSEMDKVEEWMKSDHAHLQQYQAVSKIWQESKHMEIHSQINEHTAWQNFIQYKDNQEKKHKFVLFNRNKFTQTFKYAAIFILMSIAGFIAFQIIGLPHSNTEVYAQYNNEKVILPDGSIVFLSKDAKIIFPEKFQKNIRNVVLTGEAFFDVYPEANKPFTINANETEIIVTGTSFNVKSSASKTEVIVTTGSVVVKNDHGKINLGPQEKVVVVKGANSPQKILVSEQVFKYYLQNKELVFNATPLSELIPVLEELYDTKIIIEDNGIRNLPLTTRFKNADLSEILHVIATTFNLSIKQSNGSYILYR